LEKNDTFKMGLHTSQTQQTLLVVITQMPSPQFLLIHVALLGLAKKISMVQ